MKIAVDISPIDPKTQSMHAVRGVGYYITHLKEALATADKKHDYTFYTDTIPQDSDLLHIPYFDPFSITLPKSSDIPYVVTVHDLTPLVFPKAFPSGIHGKLNWFAQKKRLQASKAVITDSEASKKDIIKFTGIPEERVAVVYLAADAIFRPKQVTSKEKKRLVAQYDLPEAFLLYVGDATWNKNLPRLIEAVKQTDVSLVMVGKALTQHVAPHPWNSDLLWVQEHTKKDPQIKKLGFVPTEDLVQLYSMATASIIPSLYEGFGLPVLEAMQSGCPVITTLEGSLPEVAGDACRYVDAYNTNDIAKAITEVFAHSSLREKLSQKGIARAKQFSWKKVAEQTIEIYTSLPHL